jgi:hypothetical protein
MADKRAIGGAPVPIRSHLAPRERSAPPDAIVDALRASLRATGVYVRLLIDRIELACTTDLLRLDGVPADALAQLTAASEALQGRADCALGMLADVMRHSVSDEHHR